LSRISLTVLVAFHLLAASVVKAQRSKAADGKVPGIAEPAAPSKNIPVTDLEPLLRQFVEVLSTVQSESADTPNPDKALYEGAIPSMLRELDPHTQFFDPGQFEQLRQMESSEQKGFGSVVSVLPGRVLFLQTLPGTPANKAGIQAGDELVAINNVAIRSLEPEQIIQLLTEARQQKITVFIRREGSARILQYFLTPELLDSPSVDRGFLLEPGFGYIRIASWDPQTAKQVRDGIEKLQKAPLRGLVIDLRNNPGGVVNAALDVASMFLQPGQTILTAKGRTSAVETATVPKNASPYGFKVSVLINEKTASASEIFAGALQDHDRATIVGETSYGKGLVQRVMPLSGGAGLAITTAFYYTPSGRSIQHPLKNSALSSTFGGAKPEGTTADPVYKTDKGRVVTGGGGIQPDLRVSPLTANRLEAVLDGSGAITSFATQYLTNHKLESAEFKPSPELLDEFKVYLSARNIQPSLSEWSQERVWVSNRLAEEIITQAQGVEKGDEVHARIDPQLQAALKAVREERTLAQR
jgi:carboxyl-terminal processing protease